MTQFRNKHVAGPLALIIALVVTASLALTAGSLTASNASSSAPAAAPLQEVAHAAGGTVSSKIIGETRNGRAVTGTFTPLRFVKRDGKLFVRGFVDGVVTNSNGSDRTFGTVKTFRVKRIEKQPVRARAAALAPCQVLDLVLGPLDLNLLGLRVHLDKVVLKIDAVPAAGNLLGNLVCAVAGLLDGSPLGGLLGRVNTLLNRILGILGLSL
jgi:hypothetical protein